MYLKYLAASLLVILAAIFSSQSLKATSEACYIMVGTHSLLSGGEKELIDEYFIINNPSAAKALHKSDNFNPEVEGDSALFAAFPIAILDSRLQPINSFLYYPLGRIGKRRAPYGVYIKIVIKKRNGRYYIDDIFLHGIKNGKNIQQAVRSVTTFEYLVGRSLK